MRALRAATITAGLALWAVLALAPVVTACMGSDCTLATGVRSAHCGGAGAAMLCCDQGTSQPLDHSVTNQRHAGLAAQVDAPRAVERFESTEGLAATVAAAGNGPPLYALYATLLI